MRQRDCNETHPLVGDELVQGQPKSQKQVGIKLLGSVADRGTTVVANQIPGIY